MTQTNLIIPYYHIVSDNEVLHVKHLYEYKNIKQFTDDIDFLLKNYSPISLRDFLANLDNDLPLPKNAFLLTFDDGFREVHDVIAPILLEKGVPATFFINSAFVDNQELCYQHKASILTVCIEKRVTGNLINGLNRILDIESIKSTAEEIRYRMLSITYRDRNLLDKIARLLDMDFSRYLKENRPYLTSHQIQKLLKDGFTIGAHSIDHPPYPLLHLSEQVRQTLESVRSIKSTFGLDYGVFAFPNTDQHVSKLFFSKINGAGIIDASFGNRGMMSESISNHFQRFSLEKPLIPAQRIIAIQYMRKMMRVMTGNSKIKRT